MFGLFKLLWWSASSWYSLLHTEQPLLPHGWYHVLIICTGKQESLTLPESGVFQRLLLAGRRISPWSAWKQFTVKEGGIKKGEIFQNHSGGSLEAEPWYPERNWNPRVCAWQAEGEGTAATAMQRSIASYHIRPLPLQRPTINTGYPTEQTENNMLPHNVSYEKCPQSLQYIFCFGLGL